MLIMSFRHVIIENCTVNGLNLGVTCNSVFWSSGRVSGSHHRSRVNSCCHWSVLSPVCINWLVSFAVMLLAVRLKWRRSVVIGQSRPLVKFGSFVMLMSWMSRLYGAGSGWHLLRGVCSKLVNQFSRTFQDCHTDWNTQLLRNGYRPKLLYLVLRQLFLDNESYLSLLRVTSEVELKK